MTEGTHIRTRMHGLNRRYLFHSLRLPVLRSSGWLRRHPNSCWCMATVQSRVALAPSGVTYLH